MGRNKKEERLAALGRFGSGRLEVLFDEGDQFFHGLETRGLAGIHMLNASAEDSPIKISFRPDLNDKVALHLAFRIGSSGLRVVKLWLGSG